MTIEVTLPRNRLELGKLRLLDGQIISHEGPALGLADGGMATQAGNPQRDPMKRNGDTPTGEYSGIWLANNLGGPDGAKLKRTYGDYPILLLTPTGGQALLTRGVRTGLAIHSGALNPSPAYSKWQQMRPTNGCVRILDATHKFIFDQTRNRGPVKVTVSEI